MLVSVALPRSLGWQICPLPMVEEDPSQVTSLPQGPQFEVSWPFTGGTDKHATASFWVSRIVPGPWKSRVETESWDSFRVHSHDYSLQSCFQGHRWVLLGLCAGSTDSINRQRRGLEPGHRIASRLEV